MIDFRRTEQKEPDNKKLQQNVEQACLQANKEVFIGGGLFEVTTTSTSAFEIKTGFKSPVRGFVVADTNVLSTFFRTETTRDKTICTIKPLLKSYCRK